MNTFILTCGISVLENMEEGKHFSSHTPPTREDVDVARSWAEGERLNEQPAAKWLPGLEDALAPLDLSKWEDRVSAERASLVASSVPRPDGDDSIVLLASDTATGVLAALINGRILAEQLDKSLLYWPQIPQAGMEPAVVRGDRDEPSRAVHVIRIPSLQPKTARELLDGLAGLAHSLWWWSVNLGRDAQRGILHLSGGYKAVLPHLTALAEYVNAKLLLGRLEVYCLHEISNEAIRIPLRRVDWKNHLEELKAVHAGRLPKNSDLIDFAWEVGPKLNPLGGAVLALLGRADPARVTQ